MSQLRDQMAEMIYEASQGDSFRVTNTNRRTGAALVPEGLLDDEDALVARLLEIAPGRLATDQEIEAR